MSKKRFNTQETVLLSQTVDDDYLRVIKVCHALRRKYGSACNAAKAMIETTAEYKAMEVVLFPMCRNEDSRDNGRNTCPPRLVTPVCDMEAEYRTLRLRSDNIASK